MCGQAKEAVSVVVVSSSTGINTPPSKYKTKTKNKKQKTKKQKKKPLTAMLLGETARPSYLSTNVYVLVLWSYTLRPHMRRPREDVVVRAAFSIARRTLRSGALSEYVRVPIFRSSTHGLLNLGKPSITGARKQEKDEEEEEEEGRKEGRKEGGEKETQRHTQTHTHTDKIPRKRAIAAKPKATTHLLVRSSSTMQLYTCCGASCFLSKRL